MSTFLSLLLLLTTTVIAATTSPSPSPQPPSQPPSPYMQQQQLKNIIDALLASSDFAAWANLLFNPTNTTTSATVIPTTATLFIPSNAALSTTPTNTFSSFDPFLIPYHILPTRLSFDHLLLFNTLTRLPTLLSSKTILITNNTPHHFTIDDSLITQPDIYTNEAVCVHGVDNVLDYKVYGDAGQSPPSFIAPPPLPPLVPADDDGETVVTPPPEVVGSIGAVWSADLLSSFVVSVLVLYVIS